MKPFVLALIAVVALAPAQGKRTFVGTITDSMCAAADHAQMQMGPTGRECSIACVTAHGATYVLYDGKSAYKLSDQRTPEKFAGQKVAVHGALNQETMTILVESISLAK